jgi:hypothetical protein
MPSADLRECLRFTPRRGPKGALFFEAEKGGRRFLMVEKRDGSWSLYERVGWSGSEEAAPTKARPRPRKTIRALAGLGLLDATDAIEVSR